MNLSGDEKRIRQLYRDLAVDDRRQTPAFARVLTSAGARANNSRERFVLKFALVVASLCLVVLVAMFIFSKPKQLETAQDNGSLSDKKETTARAEPASQLVSPDPDIRHRRKARHRRQQNRTTLALRSIFAWRSPTASLLKVPEDKLLNSLPRLGESLQTIKSISPDEFN